MAAVGRKTEHVKILQDLGYDPWEIENDDDMLSALKESINDLSRENPGDGRIPMLQDAVKGLRRPKFKTKKTPISGAKLLPSTTFRSQDIKPNEAEMREDGGKKGDVIAFLNGDVKDKLEEINQSVIEIKDVIITQGDLADDRDEEMRQAILADRKKQREKNLEKKKGIKEKLLEPITKPVGNFLNKLVKFVMMTFVGSVINRVLTLLKDPAQLLDPIKRFFNLVIGLVNAVMKGLWNVTGAPMNFIVGGINKGVSSLLDAINKATGLLKIPAIPAPQIPLIPGPPEFEYIPLSKTAQAKNEGVAMAGGGVVPGMSMGQQMMQQTDYGEDGSISTRQSTVEERKQQYADMGMPSMELWDGSVVPNFGKMGADKFMSGVQMVREGMTDPTKIEELDNFMATNPYAQPEKLQAMINRTVPGSTEQVLGDLGDSISAKAKMSGGGIVPSPYPVGDNILGLSPSFSGLTGYNKGGKVPGSGTGDTVPAMLTPGEFVMSKGAVDQIGADKLMAMNAAGGGTNQPKLMKFAGGGMVPGIDAPSGRGRNVVVIGGGGKKSSSSVSSTGAGQEVPKFSSTDPNNMTIPVIKSVYNLIS